MIIGTAAYLAPEQVSASTSDARTDVYAAGVMLFEMLTGVQPHKGETPLDIAYKHVNEVVPPPSSRLPGLPPALDALVALATSRDPDLRPADAGQFLQAVSEVRHDILPPPAAPRCPRRPRRARGPQRAAGRRPAGPATHSPATHSPATRRAGTGQAQDPLSDPLAQPGQARPRPAGPPPRAGSEPRPARSGPPQRGPAPAAAAGAGRPAAPWTTPISAPR